MRGWTRHLSSTALLILLAHGPAAAQDSTRPAPRPSADAAQPATPAPTVEPAPAPMSAAPQDAPDPAPIAPLPEDAFQHASCLLDLWSHGATYEELPAITEEGQPGCGIQQPLRIHQILPGLALEGAPVMRCETARSLMRWLRDDVRPATRFLPGAPRVIAISPGSTYQCRQTIGGDSTKISEHALGNAFDIAAFQLSNGESFTVQPRGDSGDMAMAFQAAIRSSACLHFSTVLGPGTNAAHGDHLHLDIKARNGGYRICQ